MSFNAIYAQDFVISKDEKTFRQFLNSLYQADTQHRIDHMIWDELSRTIQVLLEDPYIFQQFWDYQNHKITQEVWKENFNLAKEKVCLSV